MRATLACAMVSAIRARNPPILVRIDDEPATPAFG